MNTKTFETLAEQLTGSPVKDLRASDHAFLDAVLADDQRVLDWAQFNELLLLVNKDRVERPFFTFFFRDSCQVSKLAEGVERFQRMAMLCYGNFIHAFRTLARQVDLDGLKKELGRHARSEKELTDSFTGRSKKLLEVEPISRDRTPLVGYLSANQIIAESGRADLLQKCLPENPKDVHWKEYKAKVVTASKAAEHSALVDLLSRYRESRSEAQVSDFARDLVQATNALSAQSQMLKEVRKTATKNQDIYLTWDHMDVYFATSMRKKWEFEDLFDFVNKLMDSAELEELNLRYFDPTQAYTADRVNKGLVESLMLKRAKCTVYSVQDTDTLGKDSELAATLAQGKPVIAFVPKIEVDARAKDLETEDPIAILERLRFVIYADESFASSHSQADVAFVRSFQALERFEESRVWRSVPDDSAVQALKYESRADIQQLCKIIATSEATIYEKRARTMRDSHPLGIQVNLATGVANGVLVVREIADCARLLRRILTNTMEFAIENNKETQMCILRERISGCVYRVVSKDRKLTNCFWNFYRRSQR